MTTQPASRHFDVGELSRGLAALPGMDAHHATERGAGPMGLWINEGVGNALAARALLHHLAAHESNAEWVVLGPASSAAFFEMDAPVAAYIPLLGMQSRRPAQWRITHWWSARQQRQQLRAVGLQRVFGVRPAGHKEWLSLSRQLHCPFLAVLGALDAFLELPHPILQAGPSALAYATHVFRGTPPNKSKEVLFVELRASDTTSLNKLQVDVDRLAKHESASVERVIAVVSELPEFMQRRLAQNHPDWHWVTMTQAFGLLGYADRVIGTNIDITLIGQEMGRGALFVLDKTHSQAFKD